jgi:hypothetical protein
MIDNFNNRLDFEINFKYGKINENENEDEDNILSI